MSETILSQAEIRDILRIHKANYTLLEANTEGDVEESLKAALQCCSLPSYYYKVLDNQLVILFTPDNIIRASAKDVPNKVAISNEKLKNLLSQNVQTTLVEEADLPEVLNDFFVGHGYSQVAQLPVICNSKVEALVIVGATQKQSLKAELIEPLTQSTKVASAVLENISNSRTKDKNLKQMEQIAGATRIITTSSDLQTIYKGLHSQITESIGNIDFAVALYNSLNQTIEFPYVYEGGLTKSVDPLPLGEGIISVLIRTRQPLMIVSDTERHLNGLGAKVIGKPAKSWLGCPLNIADETIGALIIQDLEHELRFDQDDLDFMTALTNQSTGAINHIRLYEISRRTSVELQAVAEISREVSSTLIIDDLLRKAISLLQERFGYYYAGVFLTDPGKENAVLREAGGEIGSKLKRSGYKVPIESKNVIGTVINTTEMVILNELNQDDTYSRDPLLFETKAQACFPLVVKNRVLGVLDVHSRRPYEFTTENTKILQILADQLSVALINSDLFADAQERLSQHRLLHHVTTSAASSSSIQEALNSTVQGLQVALSGDQIAIMMADNQQKTLEVKASIGYPNEESARLKIPFGVGITGWAAIHKQSIRVSDVTKESRYISVNPRVRSELAIPLLYRNEVLGVLNVESQQLNAYDENDEEMLGTLAGSLAAIIAHSRLLEQYRHQVERERLLSEITNKIRRTTNPQTILSITAEELSKALNTRRTRVEVNIKNIQQPDEDNSTIGSGIPEK